MEWETNFSAVRRVEGRHAETWQDQEESMIVKVPFGGEPQSHGHEQQHQGVGCQAG